MNTQWWNKFKQIVGIPMDDEYLEEEEQGGVATATRPPEERAAVTARPGQNSARSFNGMVGFQSALTQSEVMIIEPSSFDDAMEMVHSLRERRAVIMNMKGLDEDQAQRLLDFVSGAVHALDGHQKQIGEGIFLFSPSNVVINPLGAEQPWLNRDARELFWPAASR
ncbi:MAG: cell division protein SepF [Candidatus Sericytochromatia bacterium]|nr:cell division protein SepF [Candidatus Sericytochromatia bacterium]